MLSAQDVSQFEEQGFLLLKQVFTESEIERFNTLARTGKGPLDLMAFPGLESLWADPRLIGAARQLLGDDTTFFAEASVMRYLLESEGPLTRALHHDAKGTRDHLFNRQHRPTPEPYPIIRFGIYLQDHAAQSGGLKLVPGSHQIDSTDLDQSKLSYFNVPSVPGDLVVFCNKTLHASFGMRLRSDPGKGLSAPEENAIERSDPGAFLPMPRDRCTIFIDFAGGNDLADIYIKGRALHVGNPRKGLVDAVARGIVLRDAEQMGVRLRLDAAVIEAISKIAETAVDGRVTQAGMPCLAALPLLCKHSKPRSDKFNFIPEGAEEMAPMDLLMRLLPRVDELRDLVRTVRKDAWMMPADIAMAHQAPLVR